MFHVKSISVLADSLHVTDMPSRTHSLQGRQGGEWEGQRKTLTDNTHYFHLSPLAPHGPNLTAREAGKCRWWQMYGECLLPRPHSYSQLFWFPWGGTYSKPWALSPFTLLPCFEGGVTQLLGPLGEETELVGTIPLLLPFSGGVSESTERTVCAGSLYCKLGWKKMPPTHSGVRDLVMVQSA